MNYYKLFLILLIIRGAFIEAFILPFLQNKIGDNHVLINISKTYVFKYLKQKHIESIKDDLPVEFCNEISKAKELSRNLPDHKYISMIKSVNDNRNCDYIIFYRRTNNYPSIFTIEDIYRIPYSKSIMSYYDVINILKKAVENKGIYLQIHEMKQSNKKISQNLLIENCFNLQPYDKNIKNIKNIKLIKKLKSMI
jgi:hypothetical protein